MLFDIFKKKRKITTSRSRDFSLTKRARKSILGNSNVKIFMRLDEPASRLTKLLFNLHHLPKVMHDTEQEYFSHQIKMTFLGRTHNGKVLNISHNKHCFEIVCQKSLLGIGMASFSQFTGNDELESLEQYMLLDKKIGECNEEVPEVELTVLAPAGFFTFDECTDIGVPEQSLIDKHRLSEKLKIGLHKERQRASSL